MQTQITLRSIAKRVQQTCLQFNSFLLKFSLKKWQRFQCHWYDEKTVKKGSKYFGLCLNGKPVFKVHILDLKNIVFNYWEKKGMNFKFESVRFVPLNFMDRRPKKSIILGWLRGSMKIRLPPKNLKNHCYIFTGIWRNGKKIKLLFKKDDHSWSKW